MIQLLLPTNLPLIDASNGLLIENLMIHSPFGLNNLVSLDKESARTCTFSESQSPWHPSKP